MDEKIEAIKRIPQPSDMKQIRSFLEMVGFYRKFCYNFSTIASSLTGLFKKYSRFVWTSECNAAFEQLKLLLSNSPVLITPDFVQSFYLYVDASEIGTGAVFFQKKEEINHPAGCYSKKFDKCEKRNSTI